MRMLGGSDKGIGRALVSDLKKLRDDAQALGQPFDQAKAKLLAVGEAVNHTVESTNAQREAFKSLAYSVADQAKGIDSTTFKWNLLTKTLQAHGLTIEDNLDKYPALTSIIGELAGRIDLEASQWDKLSVAQLNVYGSQNRVREGSLKYREEIQSFQKALFDQTEGMQSAQGLAELYQGKLAAVRGVTLDTRTETALFSPILEELLTKVDYGSKEWQEYATALDHLNKGPLQEARQKFQEIAKEVSGDINAKVSNTLEFITKYGDYLTKAFET